MLPKDLLVDLESGDRTSVHLEAKEVAQAFFGGTNAGVSAWPPSLNQMQSLQNIYNQGLGLANQNTIGQIERNLQGYLNTGGIGRW